MRKKHKKTAAFLLSVMLLLTAAVSPAVYAAAQDTDFSDTVQETQEELITESMESQAQEEETVGENTENTEQEQDTVIDPEDDLFSDGTDWTQETEEFVSGIEEMEPGTESEDEPESMEPLMKKSAARNAVLLAADSDDWFATAEELLTSYDTNNSTDQPGKKVYFGQNGSGAAQEWWIVGKDSSGGSLVLFAASTLTRTAFSGSISNRDYEGQTVYAKHYGASDLINTLKGLETNTAYFSTEEQNLMMDTTVYTEDRRNGGNYFTTGKLYAAYGDYYDDQYVTAGTNSSDSLNGGLRIDMGYWGSSIFWLRAPCPHDGSNALVGYPGTYVDWRSVTDAYSVVPAFQLNLSSVLFASAASAAVSDGTLTTGDTFTLRYTSNDLGTATVSGSKESVAISNVSDNTYLVAQNADGAWAKAVSDGDVISASDLDNSLTSFADCEVWLERTDLSSRLTYATKATTGYNVTVNAGQNMNLQSGSSIQQDVTGQISDITYKAAEGYYFPDDYSVTGTNGLQITVSSDKESITISGTPNADTVITLPDAPQKPKAPTPIVTRASGTASALTITPLTDTGTYGEARYSIDGGEIWQESNVFTNLKAGHTYTVWAKYLGKGIYRESEIGTADISVECLHTGDTEVRNAKEATHISTGYTGDIYCRICKEKLRSGTIIAMLPYTSADITANSNVLNVNAKLAWSGKKVRVSWSRVSEAQGYDIYAAKCGKSLKLVKKVQSGTTSALISKAGGAALKATGNYKVKVRAYRMVNGKKKYIANSLTLHIMGKSNRTYTNASKVKVSKSSYTLSKGKSVRIATTVTKQNSRKKLPTTAHAARLRYFSTNKKVATVGSAGKIRAVGKGSCYVYVAAQNGAKARVKVTVK